MSPFFDVYLIDEIKTGIGILYLLRVSIPFYPAVEHIDFAKTITDFTFKKVESERLLIGGCKSQLLVNDSHSLFIKGAG
jgi:hypothetical protein